VQHLFFVALAATCALGVASSAFAKVAARSDSVATRHVKSIRVGGGGVEIVESNGSTIDAADGVVQIGRGTITVVSDGDSGARRRRTVVNGPGIVVDAGESGLVRVFADAEVPAEETIDGDVVAVFGSVRVAGHVKGNVAAVFGSATLEPGAVVDGDVVALGGALDQANNAIVNGESVSLGLFSWHPGVPTVNVLLLTVLGLWAIGFVLGWLLMMLFPQRVQRVALTASHRTAGSFVLGVASAPLVVIAVVLLMITVVGIPFAIVLPLVYLFAVWAGNLATSYVLGCRLLRRPLDGPMSGLALAAGTLIVTLFYVLGAVLAGPQGPLRSLALFFALLGVLLALGLSVVGIGAVLLSRFGNRPRDPGTAPAYQPVPAGIPATPSVPPAV
jgi:hypothetical protein